MKSSTLAVVAALLAYVLYAVAPSLHTRITVLGLLRKYPRAAVVSSEVITIPDTIHCEDVHYHPPSDTLFTACEDSAETRFKWFPPLANFDDPELASRSRGSIHVVDPKTMKSRRLEFENFDGPYITHGIDVIPDKERADGEAVYIVAVNHVPEVQAAGQTGPPVRSRLEIFHHLIGSPSVKHLRSVWHPLIKTPNDVVAQSPTSIYVTNDHRHRFHGLMRTFEDAYTGAKWTEVVHVRLDSLTGTDPAAGVTAEVALPHLHNANGLAHGRSEREILISSCTSGVLHIGEIAADGPGSITVVDSVQFDHIVDNPSYFSDPHAAPGDDRSGFLEAGLGRAIDLGHTYRDPAGKDPVMVTYVKPGSDGRWEKRLLLEDDSTCIRSASAAVLVPIDPAEDKSSRKAWLFTTGFLSHSMIATKVDL